MNNSETQYGINKLLLVSALALVLTACGGDQIKPDADATAEGDNAGQDQGSSGALAGGIGAEGGIGGTALEGGKLVSYEKGAINDPANVLHEKVVYFEFDSNTVGDDYVELVKHHGKYLSFNPDAQVTLEGHADERGTREYNVALAERRAQSVKEMMLYEGASNNQITIVSFGEEKPVAFGHDEESMSLNRRVEIVYQ
jgi:peptidoglycan-associated lipoprotein